MAIQSIFIIEMLNLEEKNFQKENLMTLKNNNNSLMYPICNNRATFIYYIAFEK